MQEVIENNWLLVLRHTLFYFYFQVYFQQSLLQRRLIYSAIHKAAGLTVHGRSTGLPGIIPKISKEAVVLYGSRLYGGFVNSAVSLICKYFAKDSIHLSSINNISDWRKNISEVFRIQSVW